MKVCKHDRVLRCVDCENENLRTKVEEMQKALEFYAEPDTYCIEHLNQFGYIIIDKDAGEIARQALKGVESQ